MMMMLRYLCFALLALCTMNQRAAAQSSPALKAGDLLFQNLACGPLCDAINSVTKGYADQKFSHMGMICLRNDSLLVMEASGKDVHLTPLSQFLSRSAEPVYVGRLLAQYRSLIPKAIQFSMQQLGTPYDDQYLYDNGKYYCSELIYDAFKAANAGQPFFRLYPMTYKAPGATGYFPVWKAYFDRLQMDVPEGLPGCNPGGISLSEKIEILGQYH